jgi:hypothetical protein
VARREEDVTQSVEGVAKDQVCALNYKRHIRVTPIFASAKINLCKI